MKRGQCGIAIMQELCAFIRTSRGSPYDFERPAVREQDHARDCGWASFVAWNGMSPIGGGDRRLLEHFAGSPLHVMATDWWAQAMSPRGLETGKAGRSGADLVSGCACTPLPPYDTQPDCLA